LLVRLAKNHPLLDGNKRAAWVSFVEVNGWRWQTQPDIDDAESTVVAVAAGTLVRPGQQHGFGSSWHRLT